MKQFGIAVVMATALILTAAFGPWGILMAQQPIKSAAAAMETPAAAAAVTTTPTTTVVVAPAPTPTPAEKSAEELRLQKELAEARASAEAERRKVEALDLQIHQLTAKLADRSWSATNQPASVVPQVQVLAASPTPALSAEDLDTLMGPPGNYKPVAQGNVRGEPTPLVVLSFTPVQDPEMGGLIFLINKEIGRPVAMALKSKVPPFEIRATENLPPPGYGPIPHPTRKDPSGRHYVVWAKK